MVRNHPNRQPNPAMFEKPCRCGKAKMNFMHDIGPFYVADCCREAGYDNTGRIIGANPILAASYCQKTEGHLTTIPGRGRMMDTRVEVLKAIAQAHGVANAETMTKKQLVEALMVVRNGQA